MSWLILIVAASICAAFYFWLYYQESRTFPASQTPAMQFLCNILREIASPLYCSDFSHLQRSCIVHLILFFVVGILVILYRSAVPIILIYPLITTFSALNLQQRKKALYRCDIFLQKIQEEPYAYEVPPLEVIYREAFQSGVTPEQYVKINQAEDRSYYAEMLQASQKAQTDMQRIYFVHKLCFFYQIFLNLLEFVVFLFS